MTTSTFFSATGDGYIQSADVGWDPFYDASYPQARAGTGSDFGAYDTNLSVLIGQTYDYADYDYNNFSCYEAFIAFVTSNIPDGDTIDSATLSLWLITDGSTTNDFTLRVRVKAWGTLTTADWDTAYDGTLVATKATSGIGATGAYKDFTSESAFVSNVSKTGTTELVILSSRQESNISPYTNGAATSEYVQFASANETTGGGGTDHDPKLVVVHNAGATTYTKTNLSDSKIKKESRTQNTLTGTSGTKITRGNSSAGGDPFSTVSP